MNYFQLYIPCADPEQSDIWMAELAELPFASFEQEETCLKAYIPEPDFHQHRGSIETFIRSTEVQCGLQLIEAENWNALWESNFEPVHVNSKCVIRAPFHEGAAEGVLDVVIMPKMSFGTGHHATTWLMADMMMDLDFTGLSGLDMGSGTGVLAIIAAMRGADMVDAIDIDDWAYENCIENISQNGVSDRVTPMRGDAGSIPDKEYDFVLANINRNILLEDMPVYTSRIKSEGFILMSGILEIDIPVISQKAEGLGLKLKGSRNKEGWAMVAFTKP